MKKGEAEKEVHDDIELVTDEEAILNEEDTEHNREDKIKKIREKLKSCEQEKKQHLEDLQRAKAEFLNAKKLLSEDQQREKFRMENAFIESLLPMADSFHMAMHNKEAWESIDEAWRKGVESIHTQLHNIFTSFNVSEIDPQPKKDQFDPEKHEAMSSEKIDDKSLDHTIVSVIQKGYIRKHDDKETLLRPARVIIAEYEEDDTKDSKNT